MTIFLLPGTRPSTLSELVGRDGGCPGRGFGGEIAKAARSNVLGLNLNDKDLPGSRGQ